MPHSVTGTSAHCLPPPHRVPWVPSPQMGGGCSPREVEQNVAPMHTILGDHQHLSPHVSGTFPYFPVLFSSHNLHLLLPVIPSLSALPSPSLPFLLPQSFLSNIFPKTTSSFWESLLCSTSPFQDLITSVFSLQVGKHKTWPIISLKYFFFQFIDWECDTFVWSRCYKNVQPTHTSCRCSCTLPKHIQPIAFCLVVFTIWATHLPTFLLKLNSDCYPT